jgi:hypothetical protein
MICKNGNRFSEKIMPAAKWWTPPATIRDLID